MNFSNIILGSQSKQRAQILSYFHLPFLQYPSYFDEKTIDKSLPPQEYVTTLSKQKSNSLTTSYRDHFILTADTIVYQDGVIFNKPQDEHEAINMLCQLMGKQHSVYTGMTLSFNEKSFTDYQITNLHLHDNIPIKYLKNYIRTFHTLNKCGAYSIQNGGSILIKEIQGCYYNVQGLPINLTSKLFLQFGINLWDFIGS